MTVYLIDTLTKHVTVTVQVILACWGIAVNATGTKVYLASNSNEIVSVI